ncbi:MAG: hypothetical protein HY430_02585 [Candidatus Levybacteria bacterium]|nr:hypothetical protein [Candidatus Levybacteria bacterium]
MKKYFYSHLVELTSLTVKLDTLDLTKEEKGQLQSLAEANIHHSVLDTVLSELPESEKKIFLQYVHEETHDVVWDHLKSKTKNIEEKITQAAKAMILKFHEDIEEAKKR